MTRISPMVVVISVLVLGACAQPEPEPIMPEPVYNKYDEGDGGGGCVGGQIAGAGDQCIPYDNPSEQEGGGGGQTGGNNPTGTP